MTDNKDSYIVCAAIRHKKTKAVTCGPRHIYCFRYVQGIYADPTDPDYEHGFVTNNDEFLDRKGAWNLAEKQGQIRNPKFAPESILYSEHLY